MGNHVSNIELDLILYLFLTELVLYSTQNLQIVSSPADIICTKKKLMSIHVVSGSDQVNIALAVTLGVMNYLISKALEQMEKVFPAPQPLPVNGLKRRRRRRPRQLHGSQDLSDLSEDEECISSDSDMSEEELVFDAHSDSESEPEPEVETEPKKLQLGDTPALAQNPALDHLESLCQQGFLLQTIKVSTLLCSLF